MTGKREALCVTVTGQIKKIDDEDQKIFLTDGTKIDLGRIVDIK